MAETNLGHWLSPVMRRVYTRARIRKGTQERVPSERESSLRGLAAISAACSRPIWRTSQKLKASRVFTTPMHPPPPSPPK
jgi:hypothetical protein